MIKYIRNKLEQMKNEKLEAIAQDKEYAVCKILNDMDDKYISDYNKFFKDPEIKRELSEEDIKKIILLENAFLFTKEEYRFFTKYIFDQARCIMPRNILIKSLEKEYTSEELENNCVVFSLVSDNPSVSLEEVELIYKKYILQKNMGKLFEEEIEYYNNMLNPKQMVR